LKSSFFLSHAGRFAHKKIIMKTETIKVRQVAIDFLLEAADTNGSAAVFEFTVPAGAKVPVPHYHEHFRRNDLWIGWCYDFYSGWETL